MSFAQTLKSLRLKHKLTQNELADKIGVTQRTISYYEAGKGTPSNQKILNALVKTFNVTLDELLLDMGHISKLNTFVNKLIRDTKNKFLRWISFEDAVCPVNQSDSTCTPVFYKDKFNKNNFAQYSHYTFIVNESFFAHYRDGGYLLAKMVSDKSKEDISIFIFHNNIFSYVANASAVRPIEDLYFLLSNPESEVFAFIDAYLEDNPIPF